MASAGAKVFFCPRLAINIYLPIEKKNFRFLSVLHFEIRREGRLHFCDLSVKRLQMIRFRNHRQKSLLSVHL